MNNKHFIYLNRAVELAEIALRKGDDPFGSILVLDNQIFFEGHNEVSSGDNTKHPEFELSRWAANNLSLEEHYKIYEKNGWDKKEIIKQIAKDRGVNKNEIYKYFIK